MSDKITLSTSGRVALRQLPDDFSSVTCAWTLRPISQTETYAIEVGTDSRRTVSGKMYIALRAVPEVQRAFREFSPEEHERLDTLPDESSAVQYSEVEKTLDCVICENEVEVGTMAILMYQPMGLNRGPEMRCHTDCLNRFADVLDEVWNHTDATLAKTL